MTRADWTTAYPDVFAQAADKELAASLNRGSNRKIEWRCGRGHTWQASVKSRISMGSGCPYCSGRLPIPGETDLATTHPHLAKELVDQSLATRLSHGSTRKVAWRCGLGHVYEATPNHRSASGSGCPYCANKKVLPGFNDLATTHPELAAELADPHVAETVTAGSDRQAEWHGRCGHTWTAAVKSRAKNRQGCPYCASRKLLAGFNDLATTDPDLASELVDPSLATQVMRSSKRKLEWRYEHGHVWSAEVDSRTGMRSGCPYCNPGHTSNSETEFTGFVESILPAGTEIRTHARDIDPAYEFDVVVPSEHVAIEFNGVYWHSELQKRDPNYHASKRAAAEGAGYRLVSVWEDDWNLHRNAVEALVKSKLGQADGDRVHARECTFAEIDGHVAKAFMDDFHIQGHVAATRHFALIHDGRPVAVMSVRAPSKGNRNRRGAGDWEIARYATSTHVPGGFSKLLSHAQETLLGEGACLRRWISFSANDVSDGNMYAACGFELDAELPPDYRYAGNRTRWKRVPKEAFQRKRFRDDGDLVYDPDMTEHELALANDLYRCYDSGKKRWVKNVPYGNDGSSANRRFSR